MKQTTQITIEHIVVASNRSYEQVIEALEAQLGPRADWENSARALLTKTSASGSHAISNGRGGKRRSLFGGRGGGSTFLNLPCNELNSQENGLII